jgi:hypothetical protein
MWLGSTTYRHWCGAYGEVCDNCDSNPTKWGDRKLERKVLDAVPPVSLFLVVPLFQSQLHLYFLIVSHFLNMVRKSGSPPKSKKCRGVKPIGERAILSLAQLLVLGVKAVTLSLLMKMCNSDKEGSFRILIAKEKKKGLIENPGNDKSLFSLTEAGIAAAPKMSKPATQEELTELIQTIFHFSNSGTTGKIYSTLLDGKIHSLDDLARECGYDPNDKKRMGSFKVMLSTLKSKEIVILESKDSYRIANMCLLGN